MDNRIKDFLLGLIVNGYEMPRLKTPVDIPVAAIQIGYQTDTVYVEDVSILTASVYPKDATIQNVDWFSSDPSIIAINKIGPLLCEIIGIRPGTVTITARSIDGQGEEATVKINCAAGKLFTSFKIGNIQSGNYTSFSNRTSLLEVIYEPYDMKNSDWEIILDNTFDGSTPWEIINTPFNNIKLIKNNYTGIHPVNSYFSNRIYNGTLGATFNTLDGTGISLYDNTIAYSDQWKLCRRLYGIKDYKNYTENAEMYVGDITNIKVLLETFCCEYTDVLIIESIADTDIVSSLDDVTLVANKLGETSVIIAVGSLDIKITLNIEVTLGGSSSYVDIYRDIEYNNIRINEQGGTEVFKRGHNTAYIAPTSNRYGNPVSTITDIGDNEYVRIEDEGKALTRLKWYTDASWVDYNMLYKNSLGEIVSRDDDLNFQDINSLEHIDTNIKVTRVESDYIEKGIVLAIWVLHTYFGENTNLDFSISFNASEVEFIQLLSLPELDANDFKTLTFNPEIRYSNDEGVKLLHLNKLTTGTTEIGLRFGKDDKLTKTVTI